MKKVFLFVLLIGSISYYNLTAVDVSLGFVGQFAMRFCRSICYERCCC